MPYLILGIAILAGLLLLARWAVNADPRVLAWAARVVAGIVGVVAIALFALSGRFVWIAYALPFLLPVFFQWRSNRIRAKNAAGPTPGQTSDIRTRYLRMSLDHDTGTMTGTVTAGPRAGQSLDELGREELLELLDDCADDEDSVRVLEAYLDRAHGPEWRAAAGAGAGTGGHRDPGGSPWGGGMTQEEAWEILGLEPGAGSEDVKQAHRRLMAKLHPDRGGSTYLAAKLNQAKDLLLGE